MRLNLAVLILLVCTEVFSEEPNKLLYQKCLEPVVQVEAGDGKGIGSGFIVRSEKIDNHYRNVVITCQHILPFNFPFHQVTVFKYEDYELKSGKSYPFYVYANCKAEDVCIGLFESDEPVSVVDLGFDEKCYIDSKVSKIGCGLGDEPRLEHGYITSKNSVCGLLPGFIRYSGLTIPGDSGCPLFLNNKVIGIVLSYRFDRTSELTGDHYNHIGFAKPIQNVKNINKILNTDIEFAYDNKAKLPSLPYVMLKIHNLSEERK